MGLLSGQGPGAYKSVDRTNFTATAGQTTFTVTQGYYIGDTEVFLNGIKLVDYEDYTALNGSTIILSSGAAAGDVLQVVSYNQFVVSNTYTKTESDTKYMVASGVTPMASYLRTPNYGVSSWSDSANASLEASVGNGEQGVGVKAFGRSVATNGGDILYTVDSRGAGGRHRFGTWNGTTFTNTMTVDSLGRFTNPTQPLWVAQQTKTASGPQSTPAKLTSWTVNQNVGSHWNTTTNRFTCPINGIYQCTMQGIKYPQTGALHVDIYKNGSIRSEYRARAEEASGYCQYSTTFFVEGSVGDYFEFYHFGDAGMHEQHGTFSIRLVQ